MTSRGEIKSAQRRFGPGTRRNAANSQPRLFIIASETGNAQLAAEIKSLNGMCFLILLFIVVRRERAQHNQATRPGKNLFEHCPSDKNTFRVDYGEPRKLAIIASISSFFTFSRRFLLNKFFPLMSCKASCSTRSLMISSNCEIFLRFQCHSLSSAFLIHRFLNPCRQLCDLSQLDNRPCGCAYCATCMKWDKWVKIVQRFVAWSRFGWCDAPER